jgi:hypothetical protein
MTKKVLTALIALSMLGAYACDSDDDDDNSTSCTTGQIKCISETQLQACSGGKWTATTQVTAGKKCVNNHLEDIGGGGVVTDTPCTAASAAACKDACNAEKTEGYYWNASQNTVVTKNCPEADCDASSGKIKCSQPSNLQACAQTKDADCQACTPVCANSNNTAYLCNTKTGKMMEWSCNGDCSVDGTTVNCTKPGGSSDKPACTPDSTSACSDSCSADGNTRYYWNNSQSKVVAKTCAGGGCVAEDKDSCKSGGSSDKPACTPDSTSACSDSCSADGNTRYYWNNSQSKVIAKTCAGGGCVAEDKNSCKSGGSSEKPACTPESTSACSDSCSADGNTRYYWNGTKLVVKTCVGGGCVAEDKNSCQGGSSSTELPDELKGGCTSTDKGRCISGKAYICDADKGEYYENTKCSGTCFECPDNYWVGCGASEAVACSGHMEPLKDCTGQTLIENSGEGNVGDCCDTAKYAPSCDAMKRCDSTGHVAAITCAAGTTCQISTNGQKPGGGTYDQTKYPLGYYQCVK